MVLELPLRFTAPSAKKSLKNKIQELKTTTRDLPNLKDFLPASHTHLNSFWLSYDPQFLLFLLTRNSLRLGKEFRDLLIQSFLPNGIPQQQP